MSDHRWTARSWSMATIGGAVILIATALLVCGRAAAANLPPCDNAKQYIAGSSVAAWRLGADVVPLKIIEQYQAYVADLGSVGAQFGTTQTFFLSIVSAFLVLLAFKEGVRPLRDFLAPMPACVFFVVFLICLDWWLTAAQYHNLVAAKFDVLRAMEHDNAGLYPIFTLQTKCYEDHVLYGIIRRQSWLIALIAVMAFALTCLGIRRYFQRRREFRQV